MKILLETNSLIEKHIAKETDKIRMFRVNNDSMFSNWMIVLDKYTSIISQIYYKDWLFINTIFSFLLKLKKEWQSLYYKQLHTRLVFRVRCFMEKQRINNVLLFNPNEEIREYLDIECFNYIIFESKSALINYIIKNI